MPVTLLLPRVQSSVDLSYITEIYAGYHAIPHGRVEYLQMINSIFCVCRDLM